MNNFDPLPPEPLTQVEMSRYRAEATSGKTPSLAIVRRFIATIRGSITSNPAKTEKTKVSRNKKPVINEDQIDFF